MIFSGLVHDCRMSSCFTMIIKNKLVYFHLPRNLLKKFDKYLAKSTYVRFEVEDNMYLAKDIKCYRVTHFFEISRRDKYPIKYFYSLDMFRSGIKELFKNLDNTIFIDFEFNMQDFYPIKNFVGEIIETGYCVCDKNLNVLETSSMYIKPTKMKKVTKRTIKFLNYTQDINEIRKPYIEFYNEFKLLIDKYDPCFIVWGKSDIESLKYSFIINKVTPIKFKFIDLSQIHVNYYNLRNSPGLFKTAESYNNIELPKQKHNALEDALVTKLVFSNFKHQIK